MRDPELALAVSARDWSDRLHRFLADHGGARVRVQALRAEDALAESYDVLVIDDTCSFLTPHLVAAVRSAGRAVVGVFDAGEFPDGKARLVECGVTDVVEANADPDELLALLAEVSEVRPFAARYPAGPIAEPDPLGEMIVVGAPPGGCGATEVAIALARALAHRDAPTVLVDADLSASGLAQRLGLALHPNLLVAVDIVQRGGEGLGSTLQTLPGGLDVLAGMLPTFESVGLRAHDVAQVVMRLASSYRHVVVDVGAVPAEAHERVEPLLARASAVVGVGLPTPVGVTRLLDWVARAMAPRIEMPMHLVVNRSPASAYRREQVAFEVTRSVAPASLTFLPEDPRVAEAAWDGVPVERGRFAKACARFTGRIVAMQAVRG